MINWKEKIIPLHFKEHLQKTNGHLWKYGLFIPINVFQCSLWVTQLTTHLCFFAAITEPQNHRMVGVRGDLCGSPSPTPLPKQGHLVQVGFEYLQRRRIHNLSGQPVLSQALSSFHPKPSQLSSSAENLLLCPSHIKSPLGSVGPSRLRDGVLGLYVAPQKPLFSKGSQLHSAKFHPGNLFQIYL